MQSVAFKNCQNKSIMKIHAHTCVKYRTSLPQVIWNEGKYRQLNYMQVLYIEFKPWNKLSNLKQKNFPEKKKKS